MVNLPEVMQNRGDLRAFILQNIIDKTTINHFQKPFIQANIFINYIITFYNS